MTHNPLQLFDSCVHAGINSDWNNKPHVPNNLLDVLKFYSSDIHVNGALIQDSPWFDRAHNPLLFTTIMDKFSNESNKNFIYVANIFQTKLDALRSYILHLKSIRGGRLILKFHPRFSEIYSFKYLLDAVTYACSLGIPVLFCTYSAYTVQQNNLKFPDIMLLIKRFAFISNKYKSPIMLMHSGGTRILEVHDIVRHNSYLYMDLSLTMLKYTGSSIDNDVRFLLNYFDKRMVIGSDFPEATPAQIFEKWGNYFMELHTDKRYNILSGNLLRFVSGKAYE